MKTVLIWALLAVNASVVIAAAEQPSARLAARTGTVVTPRNFPRHTGDDVMDMFRLDAELGSFAIMRVDWKDPEHFNAARAMMTLGARRSLTSVLEFNALASDGLKGASVDAGKQFSGRPSFATPSVAAAYTTAALELVQTRPDYFAVATDINLLAQTDRRNFDAFVAMYRDLYPRIKQVSPQTKVFVTFQWDALQQMPQAAGRDVVRAFEPRLDVIAMTSTPKELFGRGGPGSVPADYYGRIRQYAEANAPLLVEVNWPSDARNGEAEQVTFIRSLPERLRPARPAMVAWTFLHDVKILIFTVRAGLLNSDGSPKPGFAAFKEISSDRASAQTGRDAVPAPPPAAGRVAAGRASTQPARFGVYTARLDGSDLQPLITDPDVEITHPRVSPDGRRVVMTRYHSRGRDGKATEEQGYDNTEILIMDIDGTGLETIIPPKPGVIAANGCWTPDGKALIYISTDNPDRQPEIRHIDLATRRVTRVPTPPGLATTDPHWEGDDLVFPVKGADVDTLWTMKADGSQARQVTRPRARRGGEAGLFGDFDPKLSPDRSKVAFMRIAGGTSWHVVVLDRASGQESDLTGNADIIEGLPTWSSDGRLLLYRRIDLKKRPPEAKLYTMTPTGADRRPVPLPDGAIYNHATFFPGTGSGPQSRIIFTVTRADQ